MRNIYDTVNASMSMCVTNLSADIGVSMFWKGLELECCWWHAVGLRVHLRRCVWNACGS